MKYPRTPDGRYFIVKERLWRCTNPELPPGEEAILKRELGRARAAVKNYKDNPQELKIARQQVNDAKIALGERGPVWWTDGQPDYNRKHPKNTPYKEFWKTLQSSWRSTSL